MDVNWKIMQIHTTYRTCKIERVDINKRNLNGGLVIQVPNADDVRVLFHRIF